MTRMRCSQEGLSAVKRPGWHCSPIIESTTHISGIVDWCCGRATQRQKASEVVHAMHGSVRHRETPCIV
jgi:hypothetical protein